MAADNLSAELIDTGETYWESVRYSTLLLGSAHPGDMEPVFVHLLHQTHLSLATCVPF